MFVKQSTPHISAGHRVFLLLRDLSALILLLAIAALATRIAGASWRAISWVEAVLLAEYVLMIVTARNAANRLVVNVLAHECTQV